MDNWVPVATFDEMSEAVLEEKTRVEDIALDLGLMPEKVVRIERNDKIKILIHPEFYSYYQG